MKKRRTLSLTLSGVAFGVVAALCYGWHISWHTIPDASITINDQLTSDANIYLSPDNRELLVSVGAKDPFLYIVNLKSSTIGLSYSSDFLMRTRRFALPREQPPPRDLMPNDALSFPNPHLKVEGKSFEFKSFRNVHVVVKGIGA